MSSFEDMHLAPSLISALSKQGITEPTYIQEKMFAPMTEGKDIIAVSKTGTGKTLAYLLPVFTRIDPSVRSAQCIIMAPTYELASQIYKQSKLLAENADSDIRSALIIGSAGIQRQIDRLKEKPQIIIGSSGRILDLIKRRKIAAHTVKTVVIDEADRMLDKQNIDTVKAVLKTTLKERNIVMVSASFGNKAMSASRDILTEPVIIKPETAHKLPEGIRNCYIVADKRKRVEEIRKIIHGEKPDKTLIFTDDPEEAETVCAKLNYHGINTVCIYGALVKEERKAAVDSFKDGRSAVMVATDISARGLDIQGVTHVINLDIAEDPVYYLHRAGRTGRQGAKGTVISIISPYEEKKLKAFQKTLGVEFERVEMAYGKLKNIEKPSSKAKNLRNM